MIVCGLCFKGFWCFLRQTFLTPSDKAVFGGAGKLKTYVMYRENGAIVSSSALFFLPSSPLPHHNKNYAESFLFLCVAAQTLPRPRSLYDTNMLGTS
jgi:hypothetical protein